VEQAGVRPGLLVVIDTYPESGASTRCHGLLTILIGAITLIAAARPMISTVPAS
jgi:hypothetical protein